MRIFSCQKNETLIILHVWVENLGQWSCWLKGEQLPKYTSFFYVFPQSFLVAIIFVCLHAITFIMYFIIRHWIFINRAYLVSFFPFCFYLDFYFCSGESMENALRACCKGIKIGKILIHRDGDNGKQVSFFPCDFYTSYYCFTFLDGYSVDGHSWYMRNFPRIYQNAMFCSWTQFLPQVNLINNITFILCLLNQLTLDI